MANPKAQAKEKQANMKGKPSREEIQIAFDPTVRMAAQAFHGLVALADFLVLKGVFTGEELNTFIAGRNSQAAAQAAPQTIEGQVNEPVGSTADLP